MKYNYLICGLLILLCNSLESLEFNKVVIWGHKLHSHTHSYVHQAFYDAFNYLGYPTYWYDDEDQVDQIDFSRVLFITEGQVDKNIPLRDDCFYILHNCDPKHYQGLNEKNRIALQVYTNDLLEYSHMVNIEPCIYYDIPGKCVYMPWATDLLPHEIESIKATICDKKWEPAVFWIGTFGDGIFGNINQLCPFITACEENQIRFVQKSGLSKEENIRSIQSSWMAPSIVGRWQEDKGYIPCRIFKNISYGMMGITNSKVVYDLFEEKIVFNTDTYQLFYDAKKRMETFSLEDLFEQMDMVKNKHTYINRIQTLLNFFDLIQNEKEESAIKSH